MPPFSSVRMRSFPCILAQTLPPLTVVNTGGLITRAMFTLTVTPATGWAAASVMWGADNVNFPGQMSVFEAPTGSGSVNQAMHFHSAALEPNAGGGNDGAQYFKAEAMNVSPGATATLTMTY